MSDSNDSQPPQSEVFEREVAAQALVTLRSRVDAHFDAAAQRERASMVCKPGCTSCCNVDLSVFQIEAERIRDALHRLPDGLRARVRARAQQHEHCACLVDGRCAIYSERPLICRSHGLPVRTSVEREQVDHCPLNFRDAPPKPASVLELEALNRPLAVMATLWDGAGNRVSLRALAKAD